MPVTYRNGDPKSRSTEKRVALFADSIGKFAGPAAPVTHQVVEDGIRHQNPEAADEQIRQLLMKKRVDFIRAFVMPHSQSV